MKSYEQWSGRAKQLGWSADQYSQAAYQGYVNNVNAAASAPRPSPSPPPAPPAVTPPPPPAPAPTPSSNQNTPNVQMQQQVNDLIQQLQAKNTTPTPPPAAAPEPAVEKKPSTKTVLTQGWQDWKRKGKQSWLEAIGKGA